MERKFYKTEIRLVVLSEKPLPASVGPETVYHLMTEGECVVEQTACEVSGSDMARMLMDQRRREIQSRRD
jgi:hypothetical protein